MKYLRNKVDAFKKSIAILRTKNFYRSLKHLTTTDTIVRKRTVLSKKVSQLLENIYVFNINEYRLRRFNHTIEQGYDDNIEKLEFSYISAIKANTDNAYKTLKNSEEADALCRFYFSKVKKKIQNSGKTVEEFIKQQERIINDINRINIRENNNELDRKINYQKANPRNHVMIGSMTDYIKYRVGDYDFKGSEFIISNHENKRERNSKDDITIDGLLKLRSNLKELNRY